MIEIEQSNDTNTMLGQSTEQPTALKSLPSDLSFTTAELSDTEHSVDAEAETKERIPDHEPTKLKWGSVEIRQYNRMVGDHPDTAVGPPLTFSWEYGQLEAVELDIYEENRPKKKVYLRLSSITRKNMLKNVFGIDEKEIASSEKEVQKIRKQRDHTNKQGKTSEKVEGVFQSAKRKMKRRFSRHNLVKGLTAVSGSMSNVYAMA